VSDVLVVGGGVVGATLAWRLAQQGATVVWQRADAPRSASAASGAMLSVLSELVPWQDDHQRDLEVTSRAAGRRAWDRWLAELGEAGDLPPGPVRGVHVLGRTAADVEAMRVMRADAVRHDLLAEDVDPREVPGYRPDRSMAAVDALLLADEATVDSADLLAALERAARRCGASVRTGRVERIELAGGGVVATTDAGPVEADQVVLATGAETTALLRASDLSDLLPTVLGGRGVSVLVRSPQLAVGCIRTPNRAFACGLHLVPRSDGTTYVGATNRRTTRVDTESAPHLDELTSLLGGATSELDVGLRKAELLMTAVGHRPVTLDRLPLVGRTSAAPVLVATATWRNGVGLAPVLAELMADELAWPGSTKDHPFAPTRTMTPAGLGADALRRGAEGIVDAIFESGQTGLSRSSELSAFLDVAMTSLVGGGDDALVRQIGRLLELAPLEEVLPTVHDLVVRQRG
jgi:glycine/D-amino acid oxidase-like deaminating enzyme